MLDLPGGSGRGTGWTPIGERRHRVADAGAGRAFRGLPVDFERLARGPVPRERPCALDAESRQMVAACTTSRQRHHRLAQRIRVEPVDVLDGAAGNLRERRRAARDHRGPARHRLDHRQAETFVHRGKHEDLRQTVERRQIVERHVAGEGDRVSHVQTLDPGRDAARPPSIRADADELVAQLSGASPLGERVDQLRQVLSWLDGPDRQDDPFPQSILPAHALEHALIEDRSKRGRRRFVDHVHAFRRHFVAEQDIVLGNLRHGVHRVHPSRIDVQQRKF
jgi:hypothetical protein